MSVRTRLLSYEDVAAETGLSLRTIQRMVAAGEIATVRVGQRVRFQPDEIARLVAGGPSMPSAPDPYRDHVLALVAAAPPLTSDQAARIKAVLESA
ncbi:helix-turn-helix domain-containing protein [Gordonia amarae]|uniref:helix-turn-helix domain-containing protein n=1 Tax=Gordonia amarae TaxID=36821 RepID=UPI001BCC5808|nr:helix-turn-helix domain-containing protein [Gordonia amarae]